MMKKSRKFLSVAAVALLCAGLLAGCGESSTDATVSASQESATSDESTTTPLDVTYGVVQSLDADTMTLALYDTDVEITDHSDFSGMTEEDFRAADETDSVTFESDATIEYVSDGTLFTGTIEDIQVGDMVAVTTADDGTQEVIVLEVALDSDATSTTTETGTTTDAASTADSSVTDSTTTDSTTDSTADSSENTAAVGE